MLPPLRLEPFVSWLQWRISEGYDNIVPIDGAKGDGKSTVAAALAYLVDERYDPTIEGDLIINNHEYMAALRRDIKNNRRGFVRHVDEGCNILYSLNHATRGNKRVKMIRQQSRVLRSTEFWCMPNFFRLDKEVREDDVEARIIKEGRWAARIGRKRLNRRTGSLWWEWGPKWTIPDLRVAAPWLLKGYDARVSGAKEARIGEIVHDHEEDELETELAALEAEVNER